MQMLENNRAQLTSLPLPSPALVIDTRGTRNDDVMKRLEIEIADLAGEMKMQDIHHWRYLTEFLSFQTFDPMTFEEVSVLRPQNQRGAQSRSNATATTSASTIQKGLTGDVDTSTSKGFSSAFFLMDNLASLSEDRPADVLHQNIHRLVMEVNRLRNNRHVAVADVEKTMSGRSVKDATVRVIFLTDAERPDSLATTAVYAAHLKQVYADKTHPDQQAMVNTIVLCLNNTDSNTPSSDLQELLWNDAWDHLDALILTEDYREDAAWIAGAMQPYLAELLLYVLLIIPPLRVEPANTAPQSPASHLQLASPSTGSQAQGTAGGQQGQTGQGQQGGKTIPFPPYTFLVGMAAMEHSARWGRRLLNYKLVEQSIDILQHEVDGERSGIQQTVTNWLERLRTKIKGAIPDGVPGNISALQAITRANRAITPPEKIFTQQGFSLSLGKDTLKDLEGYTDNLASVYTKSPKRQASEYTLQDAVNSIPQIQQRLHEWEGKDQALRRGTPLVNAQLEAQRVLSDPDFFTGTTGSVSRARVQLELLGGAISHFHNEHQNNPIDIPQQREQLVENSRKKIEALREHIQSIPFVATVLKFKTFMSWASLLLILFMAIICVVIAVAWLRHAIVSSAHSLPTTTTLIDNLLFPSSSLLAVAFWAIVGGVTLLAAIFIGRRILASLRAPWQVELTFVVSLWVFALIGLVLLGLFIGSLGNDTISLSIVGWLSFMPLLSGIAIFITALIAIAEIFYFTWWYKHVRDVRVTIVHDINEKHEENIGDVSSYIADTIVMYLLLRARLVGEQGGPGEYFQRVQLLHSRLRDVHEHAREQQRIARKRLTMSLSDTQLGVGSGSSGRWLNMRIREETLDMDAFADGYNRLLASLDQGKVELRMLAEMALRVMGEESSIEIEAAFRDAFAPQGSIEQHNAQILMTTLVTTALRLSFNATSVQSMTPLLQQYDSVADGLSYQITAMQSLIENLRKKVRGNLIQPILGKGTKANDAEARELATSSVAAWGQMLWEGRDHEISRVLSNEGVLPRLLEEEGSVHMIKRLLGLRTSLFGRNYQSEQLGALYLLVPYSPLAHQFSQDLNVQRRHIIYFPDIERLVLLYAQHYVGEVRYVPGPAPSLIAPPPLVAPMSVAAPTGSQTPSTQSTSTQPAIPPAPAASASSQSAPAQVAASQSAPTPVQVADVSSQGLPIQSASIPATPAPQAANTGTPVVPSTPAPLASTQTTSAAPSASSISPVTPTQSTVAPIASITSPSAPTQGTGAPVASTASSGAPTQNTSTQAAPAAQATSPAPLASTQSVPASLDASVQSAASAQNVSAPMTIPTQGTIVPGADVLIPDPQAAPTTQGTSLQPASVPVEDQQTLVLAPKLQGAATLQGTDSQAGAVAAEDQPTLVLAPADPQTAPTTQGVSPQAGSVHIEDQQTTRLAPDAQGTTTTEAADPQAPASGY